MDFWQVLESRHSVRSFNPDKKITEEQIERLLKAARLAPSAGNMQDWYFEVIKDILVKRKLVDEAISSGQDWINQAPVIIVVCTDLDTAKQNYGQRGVELYSIQDTAAATQNLLLAATELGLGTCWVGAFNEEKVKEILELSANLRPVVIVPIGYAK
ncbi:MAG: hypothetical protein A3J62_02890 [Candidatus Buchananbacteria bacterium RIFCSPHIGHO2_02_FULL_38_8]|uniref:Nitroreductase domain-containing protein n=2 Tax=Candidatus Buchananiibacteriota TaxID=1817903 RepID=A0A1G1XUM0_9BACT|nr:MAG: hypothetical protein A2731_02630 [Candidatus Buchananbacteria bacterium RIFCSPHIGHO2_01_FULL_39_8]OGY47928.1 MAG: hypothetical protein A3J62_02890 [Candidatus Buchananbacteria bacterium RIFCSPHIGHO2_02_FULL_38_8]